MNIGIGVEPKLKKGVNWKNYGFVTIGLLFIILFSVGTLALIYTHDDQKIQRGITISGINVGDLTQEEAKEIIDIEANRLRSQTIKIKSL